MAEFVDPRLVHNVPMSLQVANVAFGAFLAEKIVKIVGRSLRRSIVHEFGGRMAELVDLGLVQCPNVFAGGQRRIRCAFGRKNSENRRQVAPAIDCARIRWADGRIGWPRSLTTLYYLQPKTAAFGQIPRNTPQYPVSSIFRSEHEPAFRYTHRPNRTDPLTIFSIFSALQMPKSMLTALYGSGFTSSSLCLLVRLMYLWKSSTDRSDSADPDISGSVYAIQTKLYVHDKRLIWCPFRL